MQAKTHLATWECVQYRPGTRTPAPWMGSRTQAHTARISCLEPGRFRCSSIRSCRARTTPSPPFCTPRSIPGQGTPCMCCFGRECTGSCTPAHSAARMARTGTAVGQGPRSASLQAGSWCTAGTLSRPPVTKTIHPGTPCRPGSPPRNPSRCGTCQGGTSYRLRRGCRFRGTT